MTLCRYQEEMTNPKFRNSLCNYAEDAADRWNLTFSEAFHCVETAWVALRFDPEAPLWVTEDCDKDEVEVRFWSEIQYQVRCLQDGDFPND